MCNDIESNNPSEIKSKTSKNKTKTWIRINGKPEMKNFLTLKKENVKLEMRTCYSHYQEIFLIVVVTDQIMTSKY